MHYEFNLEKGKKGTWKKKTDMGTPFCSRYASLNFTHFSPSLAPAIQLTFSTTFRRRNVGVVSRMESTSISPSGGSGTTAVSAIAAGGDATTTGSNSTEESSITDTVVQYVVLRRDLIDTWPLGSVVTQGCHAAVAAIWSHKDDAVTLQYCSPSNIDSMHKVNRLISWFLFSKIHHYCFGFTRSVNYNTFDHVKIFIL